MERQLPKNVRQIGNVCGEPRIYMEDYVDTYLCQLRQKAADAAVAAALTGEITEYEGQAVVYISGAIQMREIEVEGTEIRINEEIQKEIEENRKEYFSEQKIVGWCLIEAGNPMSLNRGVSRMHDRLCKTENSVFIWKDTTEKDEIFYACKYGELMQMGGYYIYYERNPSMQNYMINTRRQNGVTPFEMVEDRAAKNFRSTVREKMEYREQRQNSRLLYVTSVLLVVVVLVIGISTMNNYDKMEAVQQSLESLSRSVSGAGEETVLAGAETVGSSAYEDAGAQGDEDAQASEGAQGDEGTPGDASAKDADAQDGASETGSVEQGVADVQGAGDAESLLSDEDFYIVKKGDTLDSISIKRYGDRGHVEAICKMNGLADGNLIFIGQKLLMP